MKPKVTIRPQRVSDAKRFFEILSNPAFRYIPASAETLEQEIKFLRLNREKRRARIEYNFSILRAGLVVGGIGVRINIHYPYVGEAGYFVDEKFWDQGIAPAALGELEAFAFETLKVQRLEILVATPNARSEKVAIKCGYAPEGRLRRRLFARGVFYDCYLYAKVRGRETAVYKGKKI